MSKYKCNKCGNDEFFLSKFKTEEWWVVNPEGDMLEVNDMLVVEGPLVTICKDCQETVERE